MLGLFTRALVLLTLIACTAIGETSVKVMKMKAVTGLKSPSVVGETVLIGEDSTPIISEVALIDVVSSAKFLKVKARKSLFEFGQVDKVGENRWLLSSPGKFVIEVSAFDPATGFEDAHAEVDLSGEAPKPPTPPTPPDPPKPDVPTDQFDNLGQRVAAIAKAANLPKQKEVAAIFVEAANNLENNPSATLNSESTSLVKKRADLLGADLPKYEPLIAELSKDLTKRVAAGEMTRNALVAWWRAIAKGLE